MAGHLIGKRPLGRHTIWYVFVAAVLGLGVAAAGAANAQVQGPMTRIDSSRFDRDQVGFLLFDPADGTVLEAHNPQTPFIPASVAKVPTSLAALSVLGADHRYRTELRASGEVVGGALMGDLFLIGGGDPWLSSDQLASMAAQLADAGVRSVQGQFYYDSSLTLDIPEINAAQPYTATYNTGVSSLSVNFNRMRVRWTLGSVPSAFAVEAHAVADQTVVPVDWIPVGVRARSDEAAFPFLLDDPSFGDAWTISSAIAEDGQRYLPVRHAASHTANVFRVLALDSGVALPAPRAGRHIGGTQLVAAVESGPLAAVVRGMLQYSNNMTAELVGLSAMQALESRPLTLSESGARLEDWLTGSIAFDRWSALRLTNHSGLSSESRVTPEQLAAMTVWAMPRDFQGRAYNTILPEVAWSDEFAAEAGPGTEVRAKSGTMAFVRGLSGLLTTVDDRELGFAILTNDFDLRSTVDRSLDRRGGSAASGSGAWRSAARDLEWTILLDWAQSY